MLLVHLAVLGGLRLKDGLKSPFSYIKWPNIWLYCPVGGGGGRQGYSTFIPLHKKLQFLYISLYQDTPCSCGKMELKNIVLCSNLTIFFTIDFKLPNFYLLWEAFLGKNFHFHLIGASNYDVWNVLRA